MVHFRKRIFKHAFFESARGGKDNIFSAKRAVRIDWIESVLNDFEAERYLGWDKLKKKYSRDRRVTIVKGDYVVVIAITGKNRADFITAFVADTPPRTGRLSTIQQIRNGPKWV